MAIRSKLKATFVGQLGTDHLSGTIDPVAYQRTLAHSGTRPAEEEPGDKADALPVVGDIVRGHYRLVRALGAGMFGRVYVAERTDVPEHRVAMKVVNRSVYAGRNVERELVMLAAASHPNIVELKDHGVTADYVWLTMPLYEGETLAERLRRGPLGLHEAYDIFLPVARGVAALHARGLRHQDIKPENIFLADFAGQLHPVLLDLGVAAEKNAPFVAGTALYGSPEQVTALSGLAAAGELSEKMDTYCLASTLLYALVGEKHYPGAGSRTAFDIAQAFEEREQSPLREQAIPELRGKARAMFQSALSRWLTRDPAARPSAGELADELEVLLEPEREAQRQIERRHARQRAALQRWRIVLAAFGVAAIGAGYYVFTKRQTLRLAGELERARAEGAASFDKLDTCNAAHEIATRESRTCVAERQSEAAAHVQQLDGVKAEAARERGVLGEQLTASGTKLRQCDEGTTKLTAERDELQVTLADEKTKCSDERRKLEEERDKIDQARKSCETESEQLKSTNTSCQQQLSTCTGAHGTKAGPAAGSSGEPGPYD
jgi:eukaryotic-like serine/threonine-protein kinase